MEVKEMETLIADAIVSYDGPLFVKDVRTFEEAGLLTRNSGLVIKAADGNVYHLTISEA
mgnify:CR=1 FL=1